MHLWPESNLGDLWRGHSWGRAPVALQTALLTVRNLVTKSKSIKYEMRTLEQTRKKWIFTTSQIAKIEEWKKSEHENVDLDLSRAALRSVFWKASLLFKDQEIDTWPQITDKSRSSYEALKVSHTCHLENLDNPEKFSDPLDVNNLRWGTTRRDQELRAEILKDVERCMPTEPYFQQPKTQQILLDILFVYSRENPSIGYRQGMHELLAPIVWVVEHDALDSTSYVKSKIELDQDSLLRNILDPSYIEHDAFTLLSCVMKSAKSFYQVTEPDDPFLSSPNHLGTEISPMIERSQRIHEVYLACLDPELASHLTKISVLPQIFLTRWIRLLFGGEFSLDQLLKMWDILFMKDPELSLVDLICVAMLLRIRWQLIEADSITAMNLLLNYPSPEPQNGPQTFVDDALFLSKNMSSSGGTRIIIKYGGKCPTHTLELRPQPDMRPKSAPNRIKSPLRIPVNFFQQGKVEALFQGAAKGVFNRGEKLGINQAVRGAVDEVKRNVQGIQMNSQTPDLSRRLYGEAGSIFSFDKTTCAIASRNQRLAQMLELATNKLRVVSMSEERDYQKFTNAVDVAIARVDFVRVYLEDSTLILPEAHQLS